MALPANYTAPAHRPARVRLTGRTVTLEPMSLDHVDGLFDCVCGSDNESLWQYLPGGLPAGKPQFLDFIKELIEATDRIFYTILVHDGRQADGNPKLRPAGFLSLMRIDTANRVIETGSILLSKQLQRTIPATETMYLLAKYVFEELSFRRYEWKCDNLNAPSRNAAARLGFSFEGVFRQHMIVKQRNRDTAWFSMLDGEWDRVKRGFEAWLDPGNFNEEGMQRKGLKELREGLA